MAGGVRLLEQGQVLVAESVLDAGELVGVLGAEDGPQPLGLCVAAAEAATAFEGSPQLGEGELRGLGRGRGQSEDDAGVSPDQTALLALEGRQSSGVVLAQERADLIGDLLPGPDGVLLCSGQDGDGSAGRGRWACMSVRRMFARTKASPGSDFFQLTP